MNFRALHSDELTNLQRWIITCTVMLVTVIEVLDITIVNVALPQMMGQLGANSDQITWVLTSYIVSSAIVMPLTGFLVARIGQRKLLMINILGFLSASMLCGLSESLAQIVLFRTLQGVFGASLVPMSQYILSAIFPKKDQEKAMAIWGMGIMVAPVIGPTLGGYITEVMSWRWVFYINFPVCLLAFFLTYQFIPDSKKRGEKVDWFGLLLLVSGVGCLQIFLDRGNMSNWFDSKFIVILGVIWVFALSAFVSYGLKARRCIVNLHLFKEHDFTIGTFMITVFGMSFFGVVALLPLMLEHLMGYTAVLTGLFMAPRAISAAIGMFLAAELTKYFEHRWVVFCGLLCCTVGSFWMARFNLQIGFLEMMWPSLLMGIGSGLFFVPLSAIVLRSLSKEEGAEGSGLFNFGRSLGGSIGISLLSTLVVRETQINWNNLSGHLQENSVILRNWLSQYELVLSPSQAIGRVAEEVSRQATMIAFVDAYWIIGVGFLFMLPLVFFMKAERKKSFD